MSVAGLEGSIFGLNGVQGCLAARGLGNWVGGCPSHLDVLLTQGHLSEDDLDFFRPSFGADFERAFRLDVAFLADVQDVISSTGDRETSFSVVIGRGAC